MVVYLSGDLSGYRLIFKLALYALLTLVTGALTYFIGKNFDSAIEGWRVASPLSRIFIPVFYLALAVFPLALTAGAAVLATFVVFGKQRVMYLLTHFNSVAMTAETRYLLLAPVLLAIACFLFFALYWHYSWIPILSVRKLLREVSDDLPDDLPDGLTSWLDVRISKLWERRYSSFGSEVVNITTLYLRTAFLLIEHTFFGDEKRIDEAAANARAAAEVCFRNPQRAKTYLWAEFALSPLADALWMLFQVRPDKSALDDAISARRWLGESRSWLVISPADLRVNACKLAALLVSRFEITGIQQDLTEALALARKAPSIRDADSRAEALLTLGRIEQIRFEREGPGAGRAPADSAPDSAASSAFAVAAQAYRAAASAEDTAGEAEYRLALLLAGRADRDGDDACRREALGLLRPWVEKAKASDPDGDEFIVPEQRAQFMIGLADVMASSPEESTVAQAAAWYKCAAGIGDAPVPLRLTAACGWGYHARDTADAADGFDAAQRLLPLAVWPGLGPSAQVRLLARWPELTVDAAAAQIAAGRPERAVEILEQGRVLMWSQRVALRSAPLDRLREADPELFDRLTAIRAELNAPVIRKESGLERFGRSNAGAERRAALFREWDDAARRHDLLRLPGYQDLRAAAARGPVVVLNASRQRCDALIVTRDLPVHQLELPAKVYDRTRAVVSSWRRARQARAALDQQAAAPKRLSEALVESRQADADQKTKSDDMLAWLWRDVADPVLRWLADNDQLSGHDGQLPRVWWCPTGWLTHLPLHAAGLADSAGSSVLDRVVSSYTPSLSQLIRARQSSGERRPGTTSSAQMLVLAPASNLSNARDEADLVGRLLPDHLRLPCEASKAAYLREISRHAMLHFAGHGYASEHEEISGDVRVGGLVLASGPGRKASSHRESCPSSRSMGPDSLTCRYATLRRRTACCSTRLSTRLPPCISAASGM